MDDLLRARARVLWAAVVLALSIAAITVVPTLADTGSGGTELLPDLRQAVPSAVATRNLASSGVPPDFALVFDSAVDNVGAGPLLIHGSRTDANAPMGATQRVQTDTGAVNEYENAGSLRYVDSPDHSHWHLDHFDRYSLQAADGSQTLRPDRKTGFCLGDRYQGDPKTHLPGEPSTAVYTGYCKPGERSATDVDEGMSVGWGDNYVGRLEGQSIDVNSLPAGRYVLVHRVNSDGLLRETNPDNDVASALIELSWPNGTTKLPAVKTIARCPNSASCEQPAVVEPPGATTPSGSGAATPAGGQALAPAPARPGLPTMTPEVARYFVRQSLIRRFGRPVRGLAFSCERRTRISYTCGVRFTRGPWQWRGRVWVGHALQGTRVIYRRAIVVRGRRVPCPPRGSCVRKVQVEP